MKKWCDLYCEQARFAKEDALDGSGSCRKFQAIWCEKLGRHVTKNAACEAETGAESKKISVACYSGQRGEETPRIIVLGDQSIEVVEIVKMWVEQGAVDRSSKRVFRCKGSDGRVHQICCMEASHQWIYQSENK